MFLRHAGTLTTPLLTLLITTVQTSSEVWECWPRKSDRTTLRMPTPHTHPLNKCPHPPRFHLDMFTHTLPPSISSSHLPHLHLQVLGAYQRNSRSINETADLSSPIQCSTVSEEDCSNILDVLHMCTNACIIFVWQYWLPAQEVAGSQKKGSY